eukprot:tig00021106_g18287.t1
MSKDTQLKLQRSSVEHFKADYFARMKSWWPQWREEVERHKIRQVHEYETEAARAEARRRLASVTFEKERVLAETIAKRKQQLQAVQEAEGEKPSRARSSAGGSTRMVRQRILSLAAARRCGAAKEMERALGDAAREEMRARRRRRSRRPRAPPRAHGGPEALMGGRATSTSGGRGGRGARWRQAELLQTAEAVLRRRRGGARQAASPSARDSLARDLAAARAELGDSYRADEPSVVRAGALRWALRVPRPADGPDESAAAGGAGVGAWARRACRARACRRAGAEERRRAGDLVDAERDGARWRARSREAAELLQKSGSTGAAEALRESEEREAKVRPELKERAEREARIRQEARRGLSPRPPL